MSFSFGTKLLTRYVNVIINTCFGNKEACYLKIKKNDIMRRWNGIRSYSSQSGGNRVFVGDSFKQPSLREMLPYLPKAVYSDPKEEDHVTRVTTLPNGLRVASESRFGQFCTVGFVISSGSRFEASYPSGISHFLEKLAFQSTSKFEGKDSILKELERYGGICDCQSTRDVFIYAASANSEGLNPVMSVLSDVVTRPRLMQKELESAQQTVLYELEHLETKPDQDLILMDMIHAAAYRDNTLGLPKLCPLENVTAITRPVLFTYLKNYYDPSRMVVTGIGVDHDELVNVTKEHLCNCPPIWDSDPDINQLLIKDNENLVVDNSIAQYTGGIIKEQCVIPQFAGPSQLPELAHVVIGVEGTSYNDEDFIPMCVLNMMMGGGGSFSAGGPGKGMFTRLYTNVLNRYHWMFSATAYSHAYHDTGLFCIHASATPPHVGDIVEVILREMAGMAGPVNKLEISRAKKQLQSMLLMNLEARPVVFEDVGRQVLANGHRKRPEEFMKAIEAVQERDIQRVAQRILKTPVSVAARGNISKLPSYADIQGALSDSSGVLNKSKLSLFH